MSVVKSLWASVQGDPVFMRKINGWLTMFWIAMIPVSIAFGLLSSVVYVSALSLWALVSGHWSAWQAARVEVQQQADAKELEENPIEQRVVETIIEKTELNPVDGATGGQTRSQRDSASAAPSNPRTTTDSQPSKHAAQSSPAELPAAADGSSKDIAARLADIAAQLVALQAQLNQPSG